ncbi:UDP-glycosyltransferase UGT5-like isoform X1 [Diorhabda carinulata]|uniref:UDP-glycosyltransferase UGT5-like isoform X1 n=1 Tax=Diorhabda carinulata TaxID=1163345 RepID=UPI0025A076EA|nr:UDP-glycosyltransferase UGT5-like isoform X1 [Diorhabda carinulata]
MILKILFVLICDVYFINSANILTIIPSASKSHHLPFQPLWRELASRGHQVTSITTDPQRITSLENLIEIDMSYCYDIYEKHKLVEAMAKPNNSYFEIAAAIRKSFTECEDYIFNSVEIQHLINNKNIDFDLLMIEAQMPAMFAFSWRFKCPIIAVASLDSALQFHDSMGNLVHPIVNPDYNLDIGDPNEMSFKERLVSFVYVYMYKYHIYNNVFPTYHARIKKYFGDDLPPLKDLQNNISMMFIGTHPLFHNVRPMNPNTITIGGGTHIKPPKELPKDLKQFLDEGKNGVIYFSLGSNVNSNLLTEEFKKAVIESFAEIPHKVLLKMDGEIQGFSENVLVRKWLPQQDILRHPNVKLFITQGGLQSLQESVVNGIPLIGIPFFGDQITNVNRMVKKGYGIKLDRRTITKELLTKAIKEVMSNASYQETAKAMGEIFRDEEIPSLQRAVYWTEYVIRHKGAKHLKSPIVDMPAWKFYMLDVLGFLAIILILILFVIYLLLRTLFRRLTLIIKKFYLNVEKERDTTVKKDK